LKDVNYKTILLLGLISAVSVGGFLFASSRYYEIGFPLDDAWIHQTYAKNLADGEGWSFIPGEPSAGLTAPLWALILSPGNLIGSGPYVFTFVLGWIILWMIAVFGMFAWNVISPRRRWWTLGAGVLLAIEWHLVWAASSGMETILVCAVSLAALVWLLYLEKGVISSSGWGWFGLGALIGLSVWIRPEGLTLLGPAVFVLFFSQDGRVRRIQHGLYLLIGFALVFIPYLGFNQWLADTWWPNTFYAKQAEYAIHRQLPLLTRLLSQFSLPLVGVGVALLPGFLYLIYSSLRKRKWGIIAGWLWVVGFMVLYALYLPVTYQHGRYIMPVMPVYILWGLAGMADWVATERSERLKWILSQVWILIIPLIGIGFWFMGAQAYSEDVAFINHEMVETAKWIEANTQEQEIIAAHDVGALGYFANRKILDLAGLVSPDVIPFIRDETKLASYLYEHHPAYLVTFPGWYPDLVRDIPLVYQTDGEFSQSPDGKGMAVYRWPLGP
jgi:arabinofuranosyltransferase